MIALPAHISMWETVASLQIANYLKCGVTGQTQDQHDLVQAAGLSLHLFDASEKIILEYEQAYRAIDAIQGRLPYPEVLAAVSGCTGGKMANAQREPMGALEFPDYQAMEDGGIILCPRATTPETDLPEKLWLALVQLLRSYGHRVCLMDQRGGRLDNARFTENDTVSDLSIAEKLVLLSSAKLIVGVPNEWTWIAASWQKKMVLLYPDGIPQSRWFWFEGNTFVRCLYERHRLFTPAVLSGVRQIIKHFGE